MKIEKFDIEFDQPDAVYFSSEEVKGRVVLTLSEESKINELLLELKGGSKTYWTKDSGKSRKHFRGSENYFCEQFNTKYTWAFGVANERVVPKGQHLIPFAFILPKSLPSSFEGEFGHTRIKRVLADNIPEKQGIVCFNGYNFSIDYCTLRFTCKATLERPWDSDVLCKRAFTVIGVDNVPKREEIYNQQNINISDEFTTNSNKLTRLFSRPQGTVKVILQSSKSAFIPGEKLKDLALTIKNDSRKSIKSINLKIDQIVNYSAKDFEEKVDHRKQHKTVVEKEKIIHLESCQEMVCSFEDVIMPSIVANFSNSSNSCKIILYDYELSIEIGNNIHMVLHVPLIISAIPPIVHVFNPHDNSPTGKTITFKLNDENLITEEASIRKILNDSIHEFPFYFRDSVLGAVDIKEEKEVVHYGQLNYVPKYPFFDL